LKKFTEVVMVSWLSWRCPIEGYFTCTYMRTFCSQLLQDKKRVCRRTKGKNKSHCWGLRTTDQLGREKLLLPAKSLWSKVQF